MSVTKTLATAKRVLKQLSHDRRTVALALFAPVLIITLLRYVFDGNDKVFDMIAPVLLGIFPMFMMFLITSIATLRERTSGTLDRLMTEPISKLDFVFGYALAFTILGLLQAAIASLFILGVFNVDVAGGTWPIVVSAAAAAFLGTALGLFVSVFARNEFQAVQLVIPIVIPQVFLCGLFIARDQMADWLHGISDFLPLTYSVDAMKQISLHSDWSSDLTKDLLVVVGFAIAALVLGAVTIKRQE